MSNFTAFLRPLCRRLLRARFYCLVLSAVCVAPVWAATQGTVGISSSASLDLTLTTGLSARLTGLTDFDLGTWSGSGDLSALQNICVGRNGVGFFASGAYRIRAVGDGNATDVSAFTLSNGLSLIHYEVLFNDQTGLTGRVPLTAGVMLSAQQGSGFSEILNWLFGCTVRNANVSINVPAAELAGAGSGTYTGTLTLMLIPD